MEFFEPRIKEGWHEKVLDETGVTFGVVNPAYFL
jgi:hypothetical protein